MTSRQRWALIGSPGQLIHYAGQPTDLAFCGAAGIQKQYLTTTGININCPECLALLASDNPLALLDPQEADLVRAARRLKIGSDIGLMITWVNGFLRINRVLKARQD